MAGPSTRDYPDILREIIGAAVEAFTNEGLGGETSIEGLGRLRDLINVGTYPNAQVLLYWEGGNDITDFIDDQDPLLVWSPMDEDYIFTDSLSRDLDDIQVNVEGAIQAGRDAGMTVYVATYYLITADQADCSALPLDLISPEQAARASDYGVLLNEHLRAAAENEGAVLVDVETVDETLRADPNNYFNCNHLSAHGKEIVAQLFADRLEALGDAP